MNCSLYVIYDNILMYLIILTCRDHMHFRLFYMITPLPHYSYYITCGEHVYCSMLHIITLLCYYISSYILEKNLNL